MMTSTIVRDGTKTTPDPIVREADVTRAVTAMDDSTAGTES
ncbi:hypothetical protein [Streptomyces inhibens]|nr:hypothetical protein [Streptomyces inhibens]